jgi:hypothetical protein
MWNIRSNRNIKRVYSQIWNTNQLLVSFDGCGVYRDWRYDLKWKTKAGWYYVDQNPILKPNRCCIQDSVSLTNQNEYDTKYSFNFRSRLSDWKTYSMSIR